ncbi:MAG: radical SAM protein, partial [Bacillota bacterium]|nr:radical SAM protein [Bacillota bacterium]
MKGKCEICPRHCQLEEGERGFCNGRENRGGKVVAANYGLVTSLALDPIEKKPLRRFHPGSHILSIGSFGCNLRCPFCQNGRISMSGGEDLEPGRTTPEQLVSMALRMRSKGNIGLAYTYNEPLIGYEFVLDCARAVREAGMKNVMVTNGFICREPLEQLLSCIDAMNIDVKGFTQRFYDMVGGRLDVVQETVERA